MDFNSPAFRNCLPSVARQWAFTIRCLAMDVLSVTILSFHIHLRLSRSHFPSHICSVYILPVRATPPAQLKSPWLNHLLLLFCKEYKLWRSSLHNFLHSPVTASLLRSKYSHRGPVVQHPPISPLRATDQVSYAIKDCNGSFVCVHLYAEN
jgi:ABC-type amino acid transport system permease subunit